MYHLVDVFNFQDYLIISKITKEVAFFIGANQNDNENVSYPSKIII